jgi:4'-phosphopantetheinyl transferase
MTRQQGIRLALARLGHAASTLDPSSAVERLPHDEQARAKAIQDVAQRRLWIGGRLVLRRLLGEAAGSDFECRSFEADVGRRPMLRGGLAFSVSHAADALAVAMSRRGPLGVDLEPASRRIMISVERRRRLLAAGRGLGADRPPDAEERAVIETWTRLEALAKARGGGLWPLLSEIGVHGASSMPDGEIAARAAAALETAGAITANIAWANSGMTVALAWPSGDPEPQPEILPPDWIAATCAPDRPRVES